MVNRSVEIKKPNTPVDRSENHRKNSLVNGSIFHEVKVPVMTITADKHSMATETPSTPSEKPMLSGLYHIQVDVKSMGSEAPALR